MSNTKTFFTELESFHKFLDRLRSDNSPKAVHNAIVAYKVNFVDKTRAPFNSNKEILTTVRLSDKLSQNQIALSIFTQLNNSSPNQFSSRLEILHLLVRANQRLVVAHKNNPAGKELACQIATRNSAGKDEYYAIDYFVDEADQWAHVSQRNLVEPTHSFAILMDHFEKKVKELEAQGL